VRKEGEEQKLGTHLQGERREENPNKFLKTVPVSSVLFTHDCIAGQFGDGKTFPPLIEGLQKGEINSLCHDFLVLNAVEVDGKLYSLDNRRLYCLKEYQKLQKDQVVSVRLKVTRNTDPAIAMFLQKLTTNNGGYSVRVRSRVVGSGLVAFVMPNVPWAAKNTTAIPKPVVPPPWSTGGSSSA